MDKLCPERIYSFLGFLIFNFITYSLLIAELALLWLGYEVSGVSGIILLHTVEQNRFKSLFYLF